MIPAHPGTDRDYFGNWLVGTIVILRAHRTDPVDECDRVDGGVSMSGSRTRMGDHEQRC